MSREVEVDVEIVDDFYVFENDGITPVSGLTQGGGDFAVMVWKDGVVEAATVVITEIGTSGVYKLTFTPDAIAFWVVEVVISAYDSVWVGEYDVLEKFTWKAIGVA